MIHTKNKAFTLVEIMIVIAIIGVIVAIAMPAFLRAREVSRARACQENLAKIEGAIQVHATEDKLGQNDAVEFDDLIKEEGTGYLKRIPSCPANGTYTITTVGEEPTCSISENEGAPFAPHLIDVAVPAEN